MSRLWSRLLLLFVCMFVCLLPAYSWVHVIASLVPFCLLINHDFNFFLYYLLFELDILRSLHGRNQSIRPRLKADLDSLALLRLPRTLTAAARAILSRR